MRNFFASLVLALIISAQLYYNFVLEDALREIEQQRRLEIEVHNVLYRTGNTER
jgi:hypothetical protein